MKTVILKWNPSFSSYTLRRYLNTIDKAADLNEDDRKSNWSVWDHDLINPGDRVYLLKVGFGQTGIVAKGTATSKAYPGEDWSMNDKPRYYIDYILDVMINPDAFELLTSDMLADAIPDFDWYGGHSGLVLSDSDADKLEEMWQKYMESQKADFDKASDDNLFILPHVEHNTLPYSIEFDRDYDEKLRLDIVAEIPYFEDRLRKTIRIFNVDRMMHKFKVRSQRNLIREIATRYPSEDSLAGLCADLYNYGVEFDCMVSRIDNDED